MLGLDALSPPPTGELKIPVYRPSQRVFEGLHAFEGIPLGLSFASAQETLFQDFLLKREPFLFGEASRRPPVDLVRFSGGVFKDLQSPCLKVRRAPSREPFIQPYACHGWQGF